MSQNCDPNMINYVTAFWTLSFEVLYMYWHDDGPFRPKPVTIYVVGSKSFRPDIQKPRQMENAVRDI